MLLIVLMLVLVSMIHYDEDHERQQQWLRRAAIFPSKLVAITPALYDPLCRTHFAGSSGIPFSLQALQ